MREGLPPGYDAWRTTPPKEYEPYSDWAVDNAAEAAELRAKLKPLLAEIEPILERMDEMGASGSAYSDTPPGWTFPMWRANAPEELLDHVREWLAGDWDRAHDIDLEKFEEQVR